MMEKVSQKYLSLFPFFLINGNNRRISSVSPELERNKIQYRFPLLTEPGQAGQRNIIDGSINGPAEDLGVPGDPLLPGSFPPLTPPRPGLLGLPGRSRNRDEEPEDFLGGVPWPLPPLI